jgi:glycosidase
MMSTEHFPHLPWSRQASIYCINVRQYTAEGTLAAVAAHLPRLAAMGVGILWFMPIQPIGQKNRKGSEGSYYSVADYTAVNPAFGTLEDFKHLVAQAHALGMKVILDWVANHTAWDHPWVAQNPAWYQKDAQGQIHSYVYTPAPGAEPEFWTDVVGLDFPSNPPLWPAMQAAMAFWLREADIDGFRCDVASLVPTPFWEQTRAVLSAIKPVFMLAESEAVDLHAKAFDMTYDWRLYETLKAIAQGRAGAAELKAWWEREQATYPSDAYRMRYTSNHDINSWQGDDVAHYGAAFEAMAVLAATLPGMPLVYGGQEALLARKLAFFERDPISWGNLSKLPLAPMYTRLLQLKARHPALANGVQGGSLEWLQSDDAAVLAFQRAAGERRVRVVVNLSPRVRQHGGMPLPAWGWTLSEH